MGRSVPAGCFAVAGEGTVCDIWRFWRGNGNIQWLHLGLLCSYCLLFLSWVCQWTPVTYALKPHQDTLSTFFLVCFLADLSSHPNYKMQLVSMYVCMYVQTYKNMHMKIKPNFPHCTFYCWHVWFYMCVKDVSTLQLAFQLQLQSQQGLSQGEKTQRPQDTSTIYLKRLCLPANCWRFTSIPTNRTPLDIDLCICVVVRCEDETRKTGVSCCSICCVSKETLA